MGTEIERKFLLMENGQDYSAPQLMTISRSVEDLELDVFSHGKSIKQGYLSMQDGIRLARDLGMVWTDFSPSEARLRDKGGIFYLTLKSSGNLSRSEIEKEIPQGTFNIWWQLTQGKRIEKFRWAKPYEGHILELDVYLDRELIIAEIEVPSVEIAYSLIPLGKDVTEDPKYKNKNLAK